VSTDALPRTSSLLVPRPEAIAQSDEIIAGLPDVELDSPSDRSASSTFPVLDPGTSRVIAHVRDADDPEFAAAVDAAAAAGPGWARSTLRARADVLRAAYDAILAAADDFAVLISREMGKTLADSRAEVTYAADFLRWYAEEASRPGGDFRSSPAGDSRLFVTRAPVGVCLLITPWNFPLAMAARKVAPALAAGCSVILKPAALTPLTALLFQEVMLDAGLPAGVMTTVTTTRAAAMSEAVMADPRVRKVSFTGSTEVGRRILAQTAPGVMRASLELGGNAPFLVLDDADLDRAVSGAMIAKLRNGGQSCIAANRYLVQDGIADEFVTELAHRMAQVRVGHGLADGAELGPMIDETAQGRILELVADALDQGATSLVATPTPSDTGAYVAATVLDHVAADAEIAQAEIFGPVATITRFSTLDEGLEMANGTGFGLASYVYTQDVDRAFAVADRLRSGMVGINKPVVSNVAVPFGGMGLSGLGREGGAEGLEEYQDVKMYNLAIQ